MSTTAITLVQAWQNAANERDAARLVALSSPDIELIGPRGSARGHTVLRDWLERAGAHLATQRTFARGGVVVVAQRATWRSLDTGDALGEASVASCFHVANELVARVGRYDTLGGALAAGGLGYADEQFVG